MSTDRIAVLLERSSQAHALAPLFQSFEVARFFKNFENKSIEEIIAAQCDESRAKAVLRLAIMRELKAALTETMQSGESADKRLEKS